MKAAVIVNPTKHDNVAKFQARVGEAMSRHGWVSRCGWKRRRGIRARGWPGRRWLPRWT
jgi:hypothetical protein